MLQRRSRESIQRDSASYSEVCPKALWALSRDVHDAIVERSLLADFCRLKTPTVLGSSDAHDWPCRAPVKLRLCNYHTDGCGSIKLASLLTLPL